MEFTHPAQAGESPLSRFLEYFASADQLLTVSQVAERLNVSTSTVRRYIENGQIAAIDVGDSIRIDPSSVLVFLKANVREVRA